MTYFNYEMNFGFGSNSGDAHIPAQPPFDMGDSLLFDGIMGALNTSEPIIMSDQMNGKIQISQLIFSGQYIAGIQIAKIAKKLSEQGLQATELDVKENITNTYYSILTSEQSLKLLNENINNLNQILEHTTNMYQSGILELTDVDQVKITVNSIKNNQKMFERMLQLSYNMLKLQMGVAPDAQISLSDSLSQVIDSIDKKSVMISGYDITNNINYQMMESQVDFSQKQIDIQSWSFAPTIAGFYSYTKKIKTTGFDLTPNHLAGVSLTVPLWTSGGRVLKVSQAMIDKDIAQRNQEMVEDQLLLQEKQLLYNYQSALENYDTQKENFEVAGRVYKSFQNKYQQGMASSLDLTQANTNYITAESNYFSAALTLLQAQTSLQKLYNTL
jgi:outer membrane protein